MSFYEGRPIYVIRSRSSNSPAIGVPREFAELIPEGTKFAFRVTENGFTYDLVEGEPEGLPEWLTKLRAALGGVGEADDG